MTRHNSLSDPSVHSADDGKEPSSDERVPGLDAIRFVAAFWVAMEHIGIPGVTNIQLPWLRAGMGVLFSGGAAVAVFFVLSGFVIHYPHRLVNRVDLLPFYARRHLRILLPVGAVVLLSMGIGVTPADLMHGVLWTLVCEEIYYTIYPAVHRIARRVGWTVLILISLPPAFALAYMFQARGTDYHRYPAALGWMVSWPLWLLGAWLAEGINVKSMARDTAPWGWRIATAGIGSGLMALHFHSPLNYGYTMKAFALLIVPWMSREIAYAQAGHRAIWLERLGSVSYTLYLVHYPITIWLGRGEIRTYVVTALATVVFAYAVEAPTHRLARWFGARVVDLRARRQVMTA